MVSPSQQSSTVTGGATGQHVYAVAPVIYAGIETSDLGMARVTLNPARAKNGDWGGTWQQGVVPVTLTKPIEFEIEDADLIRTYEQLRPGTALFLPFCTQGDSHMGDGST